MRPDGRYLPGLGTTRLRVLGMVLDGYRRGRPPLLRQIMRRLGFRSTNAVYHHLDALRRDGLVTWEPGTVGTVVPTCRFVPAGQLNGGPP